MLVKSDKCKNIELEKNRIMNIDAKKIVLELIDTFKIAGDYL